VGSFDRVHFLLHDGQEAQRQKDGEGIPIRHPNADKPRHQVTDVRGPDEDEGRQHHDRDTQEEFQATIVALLANSKPGNGNEACRFYGKNIDDE